jgi:chemotaxis protein CheD
MRRISIIQGEHAVVAEPGTVIATVLGSCVAVCLRDPVARVGGMNHFLLGEPAPGHRVGRDEMQRYGVHAMELLINALMQAGADPARLHAHLYGGATMVAGLGTIGTDNAKFARRFMATEGIAVGHADLGGSHARKVEFQPHEGRTRSIAVADAPPLMMPPPAARTVTGGELELF